MNKIELQQTLPEAFAGKDAITSQIWHKQVVFERGQVHLIEAASGTGKSSLCNFIYGYRKDYQGIICFDGVNVLNYTLAQWVECRRTSLSMLFQELRLFPGLTAWENVRLKNALTGFRSKTQIKQWFEELGIAEKWDHPAEKLSFGQQQRVAFIRALCQPSDFIFLDEPISHLDEANAQIMSRMLMREVTERGVGVVTTSIGKHLPMDYHRILSL